MTTKPFLRTLGILFVMLLLAVSLAACRKPASTPIPEATVAPTESMGLFENAATQTAIPTSQPPMPTAVQIVPAQATAVPPTVEAKPEQPQANSTQPPAAAAVQVPAATPGIPQTYTLQKGEYPYCIARRFNLDPAELLGLNSLGPSSVLNPGTVLKIPQTGHPFITDRALKSHPTTYNVQAGDTLYTIACEFGDVSPDMIALANGLSEPYEIKSGDKLNIP